MNIAMNTTNQSFTDMMRNLQLHRVSNNDFMLNTINPNLVDFSAEKYMEMDKDSVEYERYNNMVIEEAKNNVWFYFRELVRVPDEKDKTKYTHFNLTTTTAMMIYLYQLGISFIVSHDDYYTTLTNSLLWNYHKVMYNKEILFTPNLETVGNEIIKLDEIITHTVGNIVPSGNQSVSHTYSHIIPTIGNSEKLKELCDCQYDKFMEDTSDCSIFTFEKGNYSFTDSVIEHFLVNGYHLYFAGYNYGSYFAGQQYLSYFKYKDYVKYIIDEPNSENIVFDNVDCSLLYII